MSTNLGDRLVLQELEFIRSEKRKLKLRKTMLEQVAIRLQSRLEASRGQKHRHEMSKRIAHNKGEQYGCDIELGYLDRSWTNIIVRAKMRGLVDDRQIRAWQEADHDI